MPTEDEIRQQQEAAKQELQTLIHSAVATHLKPLREKLLTEMKSAIPEAIGPLLGETLKGQFEEFKKTFAPNGGASGGQPGAGAAGAGAGAGGTDLGDLGKHPAVLALRSELDKIKDENVQSKRALAEANEKAWQDGAYGKLQALLTGKVKPELLDVATDHLAKRIAKHDDGAVLFKIMKSPFQGMPEEEQRLPLDMGVDEWMRSNDGKRFLPPPSQKGQRGQMAPGRNGMTPTSEGPQFSAPAKTDREKNYRALQREAHLAEQFPNLAKS